MSSQSENSQENTEMKYIAVMVLLIMLVVPISALKVDFQNSADFASTVQCLGTAGGSCTWVDHSVVIYLILSQRFVICIDMIRCVLNVCKISREGVTKEIAGKKIDR